MDKEINTALRILGEYAYEKAVLEGALQKAAEDNLFLQRQIDSMQRSGEAEDSPEPLVEAERMDGE